MKAGKNTPQSVLSYIDAVWERHELPDPLELARELGYKDAAFIRLKEKHGDGLILYLEGVKRQRTEKDRWMARQGGRYHPQQYVSSRHGAIDDDPAVDEFTQKRITEASRKAEVDRANEILLAVEDVRQALRERAEASPAFRKMGARSIYRISAELDRMVKNAKRRAA